MGAKLRVQMQPSGQSHVRSRQKESPGPQGTGRGVQWCPATGSGLPPTFAALAAYKVLTGSYRGSNKSVAFDSM
ncbi:hypothetical protein GCM10008098_30500 [Rhodanobacter panaciterrae]|uniref:Uncharacterized protein n=1 Tax=Rhodanobacter panaciterrae TaxID=490572 RepID=A0ABQ3A4H6_9GAMM|nr:hypothetical protein GCM10008098_30500 [Rhodanobacter panaciterrae]